MLLETGMAQMPPLAPVPWPSDTVDLLLTNYPALNPENDARLDVRITKDVRSLLLGRNPFF